MVDINFRKNALCVLKFLIKVLVILDLLESFELSDGQTREESVSIKYVDDVPLNIVRGSYSFIGDDGKRYIVNYISDEQGHRILDQPSK
jgi:hypothetical protein